MRWTGVALFLAAGWPTVGHAQTGSAPAVVQRAQELARSSDWRDKAWGVYLMGTLHADGADKLIVEQLRVSTALRNANLSTEDGAFLSVLFDAAIQAGVHVPAVVLEPYTERHSTEVLILLAQGMTGPLPNTDGEELLLKLGTEESNGAGWLAANNLLYKLRSKAWFAALAVTLRPTHRFLIHDPNTGLGGIISGGGWGRGGDAITFTPKGFPPTGIYGLEIGQGIAGDVLVTGGPESVFYRRTLVPTDMQTGFGIHDSSVDKNRIKMAYLAGLSSRSAAEISGLVQGSTEIEYVSPSDTEQRMRAALDRQALAIAFLFQEFASHGLTASGVVLRIVPTVDDQRVNQRSGIQVPETKEFRIE